MAKDKGVVKIDSAETNRTFKYSKGTCNLSFVLRVDVKQELKDFAELLEVALKEVNEEINKKNA